MPYRFLIVFLLLLLFTSSSFAQVTPTCGISGTLQGLEHSTFDAAGFTGGSPNNTTEFQTLVNTYGTPALNFGTGIAATVNGVGNPFGNADSYLSLFTGYIFIASAGNYTFAVDGDDAVEVLIDGNSISGDFGLHGSSGSGQNPGTVFLAAGFHDIVFRHHENFGGDSYFLYWQQPSDANLSITPSSVLSHCPSTPITFQPAVALPCSNPLSGLAITTYDKTGFPHPNNTGEFATQIAAVAIPANEFGYGSISNIDTPADINNNPFGNNAEYLTIIDGYINAPTTGLYFFGVDGDDAVEVFIDGILLSGFYGGHGRANAPVNTAFIALDAGFHRIEYHHEEVGGGDNYHLYWQAPGDAAFSIVPNSVLEFCPSLSLNPDIPSGSLPCSPTNGVFLSTYDRNLDNLHPNNEAEFASLINNFAVNANLFGNGIVNNIDTVGQDNNPFEVGNNGDYLSIFEGLLFAPSDGLYRIGVDGDDAVEVAIDGTIITGFYGSHGNNNAATNSVTIGLEAGYHLLEFHHEEINGGDNYGLYWQLPDTTNSVIVPNSNLFNCPLIASLDVSKSVNVTYDPVSCSGLTCGVGENPKAISESVSLYNIEITNNGLGSTTSNSLIIDDSLPANTALFVGDLNGSGLPIRFFDGNSTSPDGSGCTLNCSNLIINPADISYSSNNGATYTYTPIPDANGYDNNVTNIRVIPTGVFTTNIFAPPRIQIELQVRLNN